MERLSQTVIMITARPTPVNTWRCRTGQASGLPVSAQDMPSPPTGTGVHGHSLPGR